MNANANEIETSVVPVMRYRDLPAAIDWLCKAFGFEKYYVVTGKSGAARFAQLTFGKAMIMLGSVQESAFDKLMKQPDEIGGAETQTCYFFVADAHAHCVRARAAGAAIVFEIKDELNGGRSYSCRDPEGHIWNFGTYNPWQRQSIGDRQRYRRNNIASGRSQHLILAAGLLVTMVAAMVAAGLVPNPIHRTLREIAAIASTHGLFEERPNTSFEQLARERSAKEAAERAHREAGEQLTRARGAVEAAERATSEARQQLAASRSGKEAAERTAEEARERLARARRAAKEARQQLARERSARNAAESRPPASQPPSDAPSPGWQ